MRKITVIALVASMVVAVGCATQVDNTPPRRVSPDYEVIGETYGMRAFVYGRRTVLEYQQQPAAWISIRDAEGAPVPYEREGKFIRLSRQLDRFSVWSFSRAVTFTALRSEARAAPVAPPAPAAAMAVSAKVEPVRLQVEHETESGKADLLVHLVSQQIDELRRDLAAGRFSPGEARTLKARLTRIERMLEESTTVMQVHFEFGKSDFRPKAEVARALVDAAKLAELVNVRGRTDATSPSPGDARVARLRAAAARDFLVERGVSPEKIKVYSLAAGDPAATTLTAEGRARNRRVEIEFVNGKKKPSSVDVAMAEDSSK